MLQDNLLFLQLKFLLDKVAAGRLGQVFRFDTTIFLPLVLKFQVDARGLALDIDTLCTAHVRIIRALTSRP